MALQPIKFDPNTGNPLFFRDDVSNRIYTVDNTGNYVEVDNNGNPIQQVNSMYPQQGYGYRQQQQSVSPYVDNRIMRNQQQARPMQGIGSGVMPPIGNPLDVSTSVTPSSYKGRTKQPPAPEPQTTESKVVEEEVNEVISLIDYEPEPGSELVPLINTSKEKVECIVNDSNKTYKILVVNKEQ